MPNATIRANARVSPKLAGRSKSPPARRVKGLADDPFGCLSFVAIRNVPRLIAGRYWWHVKPTGDYGADCKTGEALALEYLAFEEKDESGAGHLQVIVGDMPRDLTGIEVGFLATVSCAAGAGAWKAREEVSAYWDRCSKGSVAK